MGQFREDCVFILYSGAALENKNENDRAYDPFQRGPAPVGTRQFQWTYPGRDHTMPVDVWYPANESYRGHDLDPATMDTFEPVPGMGETQQQVMMDAEPVAGVFPRTSTGAVRRRNHGRTRAGWRRD